MFAHVAGDYIVQSDWMAQEKTKHSLPALIHAVTYASCFLPITRSWKALSVIGGTHFVIDRFRLAKHLGWAKNQVAPKRYRPPHTPTGYSESAPDWLATWLMIIGDNWVHAAINHWAIKRWGR